MNILATFESGTRHEDPNDELLLTLVRAVDEGYEEFLIVERADDPQQFVQVAEVANDDGIWRLTVEYRDGGPEAHYRSHDVTPLVIQRIISDWAARRPGWRDHVGWQKLDFA